MSVLIILTVALVAYANGANDIFKGVSTLFGSGTTSYRLSLAWATLTTLAGSILALRFAQSLVARFQGTGMVPEALTADPTFLLAVSLGAGLTVLVATLQGLPVSTTHGLTGALIGAGLAATGGSIEFSVLISTFFLPLLLSPVLALLLTLAIYPVFGVARRACGITSHSCLCVGSAYEPVSVQPNGSLALARTGIAVQAGQMSACVERYEGRMLGLEAGVVLDSLHYASAGAVGFARGLNDTPKIVALLLASRVTGPTAGLILVAVVMAVGGILSARRVAETMSQKITRMTPGQGFTANLVTSLLVTLASGFGLPVSTTHVAVGALFGIGTSNGTAHKDVIFAILLAWITTLPLAALFAGGTYWLLGLT